MAFPFDRLVAQPVIDEFDDDDNIDNVLMLLLL